MAKLIKEKQIDAQGIYKWSDDHTWALDFYNRRPTPVFDPHTDLEEGQEIWLYTNEKQKVDLFNQGWEWSEELEVDQFRITRLQARFLNPHSRKEVLRKHYLLKMTEAPHQKE